MEYVKTLSIEHSVHRCGARASVRTCDRFHLAPGARNRGRPHHDVRHLHAMGHSCGNVFLPRRALRLVLARQRTEIHHRSGETEATNIRSAKESRRTSMK